MVCGAWIYDSKTLFTLRAVRALELVGPLRQLARLLDASGDTEEAEKQRELAEELMGQA